MALSGCDKEEIKPSDDFDEQLETLCDRINTNVNSIQSLVDAIYENDVITSITPLIEDDKEVGYTFSFAKNQPISIYYGNNIASPSIGVKQDNDSVYYWTLDDDWLLNGNGKKIISYGRTISILPQFKIIKNEWFISLDNGKNWENLGKGNNALFSDINLSDADKVIFTLSNGTELIVARQPEITITFNVDNHILVEPNSTISIDYIISGKTNGLNVEIVTSGNIKAEIESDELIKGRIKVTTGETIGDLDKVILIASNNSVSTSKSLSFEENDFIHISNGTHYNVGNNGGSIELNIETNTEYAVSIPAEAQSWITVAQSRTIRQETITLNIATNDDAARTAKVCLINDSDITLSQIQISQDGQSPNTEIPSSMTAAFPDNIFRNYILKNFDSDSDGSISEEEALAVTQIEVQGNGYYTIKSLEGIQYFQNLAYLDCSDNEITTLNLSANKVLATLFCNNNQIASLDVSNCTEMTELRCNANQIPYLNLSKCTSLRTLDCSRNDLTSLDLSNCTSLTYLSCSCHLKSLDLNCPALTYLDCYGNQLSSLDLTNCSALTHLYCYDNLLTTLNLSDCSALTTLQCSDNRLSSLDLSNCPALTDISCYDNRLTALNLSNCFMVAELHCSNNQLSSLDLSDCQAITSLSCAKNFLTSLNISDCPVLTSLWCESNKLISLKVSNNPALTQLWCSNNQITSLNISNCPALTSVNCHYNMLTTLDSSDCPDITYLDCSYNQMTSLDLSKNTNLIELHCYHNKLVDLDLTKNTALSNLYCYDNKLTSLDLTQNTNLIDLDCYNNQLTSLDLSKNTALTLLECSSNSITSLDLSNNLMITELKCVMPSLKTLYLKTGYKISGININRTGEFINSKTEVIYID